MQNQSLYQGTSFAFNSCYFKFSAILAQTLRGTSLVMLTELLCTNRGLSQTAPLL